MTIVLLNVHRTINNNVIIHKTQNKLPEPKYLATEIGIRIARSQTSGKTMVNTWKLAPDKYTVRRFDNN